MNLLKKSNLLLVLLSLSVLAVGCKKDDEDNPEPQNQETKFLDKELVENQYIKGTGTSSLKVGTVNITNPFDEQMKVTVEGSSQYVSYSLEDGSKLLHKAYKTLTVFYVVPTGGEEKSIDTEISVYLNTFGTDDKREENKLRVKVKAI